MVDRQTLTIAFNGQQITAESNAPEVLAGLARIFGEMRSAEAFEPNGKIFIDRDDGAYQLHLADQRERIQAQSLDEIINLAEHEIATYFIRMQADLLWFHGGAAALDGQAVLFVGEWGQGKSTLVTSLYQNGWQYLSDEIIPIDPDSDHLLPFPQIPRVRKAPTREISREDVRGLDKFELDLDPETVARSAIPISAIIFPVYEPQTNAELIHCSPAATVVKLVDNCLNFSTHHAFAVSYLSGLVQRVPSFRLQYNNHKLAAQLIIQEHLLPDTF